MPAHDPPWPRRYAPGRPRVTGGDISVAQSVERDPLNTGSGDRAGEAYREHGRINHLAFAIGENEVPLIFAEAQLETLQGLFFPVPREFWHEGGGERDGPVTALSLWCRDVAFAADHLDR